MHRCVLLLALVLPLLAGADLSAKLTSIHDRLESLHDGQAGGNQTVMFYVLENDVARQPINPTVWQDMKKYEYIFIGGQHRSGTSLLHYMLAAHSDISGMKFQGESEGQHAQTVYPSAAKLTKKPNPELKCGTEAGLFPVAGQSVSKSGFLLFMHFLDAHLTERSLAYLSPRDNEQLYASWSAKWDRTSHFRVEKSPPDLVRMRFLQAHFPNSQIVLTLRHPLGVALPRNSRANDQCGEVEMENFRAHLQHFLLGWHWFVPEDLPHLSKVVVLRLEDLLLDANTTHAALLAALHVPYESIHFQGLNTKAGQRKPLFFHGAHTESLVTIDTKERTDWIRQYEPLARCLASSSVAAEFKKVLQFFEPALNVFGYSAHPPYILPNTRLLERFPAARWQAVTGITPSGHLLSHPVQSGQQSDADAALDVWSRLDACRSQVG